MKNGLPLNMRKEPFQGSSSILQLIFWNAAGSTKNQYVTIK